MQTLRQFWSISWTSTGRQGEEWALARKVPGRTEIKAKSRGVQCPRTEVIH